MATIVLTGSSELGFCFPGASIAEMKCQTSRSEWEVALDKKTHNSFVPLKQSLSLNILYNEVLIYSLDPSHELMIFHTQELIQSSTKKKKSFSDRHKLDTCSKH